MHCRLVRNAPTPNHPQKALKSDRRNFARFGPCHAAAPLRPSPHSVTDAAERSRFPAKEHLHTALSCTLRGTEPVRPPALSPCLPPPGSGRAPLRRSLPAPFPSRSPRGRGGGGVAGGELSASRPHLPFHGDVPLPGEATERGSADPAQPQRSPSRAAPAPGPPAPRGASPGGTTPPPPGGAQPRLGGGGTARGQRQHRGHRDPARPLPPRSPPYLRRRLAPHLPRAVTHRAPAEPPALPERSRALPRGGATQRDLPVGGARPGGRGVGDGDVGSGGAGRESRTRARCGGRRPGVRPPAVIPELPPRSADSGLRSASRLSATNGKPCLGALGKAM